MTTTPFFFFFIHKRTFKEINASKNHAHSPLSLSNAYLSNSSNEISPDGMSEYMLSVAAFRLDSPIAGAGVTDFAVELGILFVATHAMVNVLRLE
jgi:hypothetical protein